MRAAADDQVSPRQGHAGTEAERRRVRQHALGVHQQLHGRSAVALICRTGFGGC